MQMLSNLLDEKLDPIHKRLDQLESRMEKLETRMDQLETRMEKLETRMDQLETRMDQLEASQTTILSQVAKNTEKLLDIEKKLDDLAAVVRKHEIDIEVMKKAIVNQ